MPTADTARPFALLVGLLGLIAVTLLWRAAAWPMAELGRGAVPDAGRC